VTIQNSENPNNPFTYNQLDTLISGNKLFIQDTTLYDSSFIHGLFEIAKMQTSFFLIDDSLIVTSPVNTNPDTIVYEPVSSKHVLPTNLKLNEEMRFSTKLSEKAYELILKRTNFTNIEYQLIQNGKTIKSGTAILDSSFYLGDEGQDDENGNPISLKQYNDNKGSASYLKVETTKAKRATFTFCSDKQTQKYETLPMFFRE